MIYNGEEKYKVKYYTNPKTGKASVRTYIKSLPDKDRAKVYKYIEFLRRNKGYLDEPYSRHIKGKIRELRVDFGQNKHRIFYFVFIKKTIILLHAFLKKTAKTPKQEIITAEQNYYEVLKNQKIYEEN